MSARKFSIQKVLPVLLCSSVLVGSLPRISAANTNPGFSFIWGGRDNQPAKQLSYALSDGTPGQFNAHWKLKVARQQVAISTIRVTFPDYFDGKLNEKRIKLREASKSRIFNIKKGKEVPIASITVDNDSGVLEIIPETPIPAGKKVDLVMSGVKNPKSSGMYFVNCSILSPGDVPLPKNIGTWVMSFYRN